MNRIIVSLVIGLALVAPIRAAHADPPTPAQLEAAKKAYDEGKALHDAGNLAGAIDKFKESYRLSKNPLLLYNIGYTMDEAGKTDEALLYYNKFLTDAPEAAPQRAQVKDRVKALEKAKLDADLNGGPTTTSTPPTTSTTPSDTKPTQIKPAGTYGAKDFEHQIVEEAPPGKPLDISAFVPQDSGFQVTLFYRGSGEASFTSKPMKWHYHELVARIPAAKMQGNSIQYYIEVHDQAGKEVARSGKATDPNLVNIDPAATPKFYPDLQDDGSELSMTEITHRDNEDNPLGPGPKSTPDQDKPIAGPEQPEQPLPPGTGFLDAGSKKFEYTKWGTTGGTVALVGLAVAFNVMAHSQASSLAFDATHDNNGNTCTSPCRPFDSYDKSLEDAGHRDQAVSNVTLGVGVAAAVVAGYFWYRELTHKKHGEVGPKPADAGEAWLIGPSVGAGYTGAAAAVRF